MSDENSSAGKFVVVVAEDDELIRFVISQALSDADFIVVEAQHADEAIAVLHDRAKEIHALFTDIHMPGSMDGLALAHLSRSTWPWIVLLITSGEAQPQTNELPAASRFLPKPYQPHHAVNHLREMLTA